MSDDDPNTPLEFPVSDTEYYPKDVETQKIRKGMGTMASRAGRML